MSMFPPIARAVLVLLLLLAATVASGEAPAKQAPMGQGEANITVRSDVTMAIRGTRGTTRARLEALGGAITQQMGPIRACYRRVVAKRPTTVGAFAVTVELDAGGPASFDVEERGGSDADLKRCVMRTLAAAPLAKLPTPAAAVVLLTFDNSRAAGQEAFERAQEALDEVTVEDADDGRRQATFTTADGRVSFVASAAPGARADAAVTAAIRGLRSGFAAFLDCRRRAGKRDLSPAGTLDARLRLKARGRSDVSIGAVTVAHGRAPSCVTRAFKRIRFPKDAPAGERVAVQVRFEE